MKSKPIHLMVLEKLRGGVGAIQAHESDIVEVKDCSRIFEIIDLTKANLD